MREKLYILGKSTYAISIILDIYKLRAWESQVVIVKNFPDKENSSAKYGFENGVKYEEISMDSFSPEKTAKYVVGSIGKGRKGIVDLFSGQCGLLAANFKNLIHPSAIIADTVTLGHGIHVGPLSVVAPYAVLSNHSTVNRNVSVGHHTTLREFACLNPGVNVSGLCDIGMNTVIGTGASVVDQIKIGDQSVIGAGSVVTRNIGSGVVAFGVPAKVRPS